MLGMRFRSPSPRFEDQPRWLRWSLIAMTVIAWVGAVAAVFLLLRF
jgi:hypothetical protein